MEYFLFQNQMFDFQFMDTDNQEIELYLINIKMEIVNYVNLHFTFICNTNMIHLF